MLLNKRVSILAFIKLIQYDIITICSYAVVVGILDQYSFLSKISVPIGITATIGTAVSLLLAFRTAQSYERWWEARIIWGSIVNDSRTFIRQLIQFLPESEAKKPIVTKFTNRQIIWCYALSETLRRKGFSDKVTQYINQENINDQNIPNALLNRHSDDLANSNLQEYKQVQIDSTLSRLCDAMGKCERIKNTVFPRSYSLLVHLLIYVFATLLPFGLDDKYIEVEILLTAIIPLIFISIERTAIVMQDPFENTPMDTPMTSLSTTIEINLKQMSGDGNVPTEENPNTYYIM
ncbi:MAG: bestrophin family ion channel [Sediminibacterium sp.]|jgi:ion channel-forming bestrophin family protein|uniref:bestrophin family protein n=1 Tax=Sediminibacterium sp. TaxID=1917865 RepID=UPI002ABB7CFD|nr:bestrophin family ion channel [Sediminibacterium sp.]MDZ4071071.1 bestrophin family ion channel [Sediminibacterium sp.]